MPKPTAKPDPFDDQPIEATVTRVGAFTWAIYVRESIVARGPYHAYGSRTHAEAVARRLVSRFNKQRERQRETFTIGGPRTSKPTTAPPGGMGLGRMR